MTKTFLDNTQADSLISRYLEAGGDITGSTEGCLTTFGVCILEGPGLKNFVLLESYRNEWTSWVELRTYGRQAIPAKFYKMCESENE